MKYILSITAILLLVIVGSTAYNLLSVPSRVVNNTITTNNIISSYEGFYDRSEAFKTRVSQIQSMVKIADGDPDDKMLRSDIIGIKQHCRELAAEYNASAQKANKGIFKSNDLPDKLNAEDCEIL